jgi:hypothetical protein
MRPIVLFHRRPDSEAWAFFLEVASLLDAGGSDLEYWILGGSSPAMLEVAEALDLLRRLRIFGELPVERVHRHVARTGGLVFLGDAPASIAASAKAARCPAVALGGAIDRDAEAASRAVETMLLGAER